MYTERHTILLGVGLIIILPMCFARSLSALGETHYMLQLLRRTFPAVLLPLVSTAVLSTLRPCCDCQRCTARYHSRLPRRRVCATFKPPSVHTPQTGSALAPWWDSCTPAAPSCCAGHRCVWAAAVLPPCQLA